MIIFATPDFGASGILHLLLLIGWTIVFAIVAVGIWWGARLYKKESRRIKTCGILVIVVSGMTPLFCCLAPPLAVRFFYGNYPIGSYPNNTIIKGMSPDEVTAILGNPHERVNHGDGERWYYWIDSFGIGYFGVLFGPDGRVIGTHGN